MSIDQSTYSDKGIISSTKSWIAKFVIKLNLCPFAHVSYNADQIVYKCSYDSNPRLILNEFWNVCHAMLNDTSISNSFLILPKLNQFKDLLSFQAVLEVFLEESELDDKIQIVAFHPQFIFAGESLDNAGNFVNRSPFPMIHLLRVEEVESATKSIENELNIPLANKQKLEDIGTSSLAISLENYLP